MYRFKNTFKKFTALTVVATLVLSLFSVSFSAFALTLGEEFTYSFENPGVVTDCDLMNNLSELELPAQIIETPYATYSNGTATGTLTLNTPTNIVDYSLAAATDASGRYFYTLKEGKAYTDTTLDAIEKYNEGAYAQVVVPFKTPIKLKHIVVAGMHRNANWRHGEYEIYASSSRGELFAAESLVYKRNNTTDKNQVELYSFKDGEELRNISYIALRILKPHAVWDLVGNNVESAIRPRFFEFNAYGTPENPDYIIRDDYSLNYNMDSINLENKVVSANTNFSITLNGESNSLYCQDPQNINDYDITTGGYTSGGRQAFFDPADGYDYFATTVDAIGTRHINGKNTNTGKDQYVTIETEFLSEVDVEDILIVNHNIERFRTGLYEIFAAATKADLYKAENSIVRFDNTGVKQKIQDIHFDTDKELKGIKYVAMRIYNPIIDWYSDDMKAMYADPGQKVACIYPRIMEFNVYGKWSDPNYKPPRQDVLDNVDGIDKSKTIKWTNAIFQLTDEEGTISAAMSSADKIYDYKYDTGGYVATRAKPFYTLKDGVDNTTTNIDDIVKIHNDGSRYFTMILEAPTGMTISDFVMVNHANEMFRTKSYEIFASDKMATLFDAEKSVLKFDNVKNKQIQNVHFNQGEELTDIKFIALRVYDPVYSWTSNEIKNFVKNNQINQIYPRIMEFNAYGVYTDPNYQPPAFSVLGTMDEVDTTKTFTKTIKAEFTMNGKTEKVTWTGIDKLNDSNINTGSEFHYTGGTKFWNLKEGYSVNSTDPNGIGEIFTDGSRYLDLTYKFPTETKVQDIVIAQHSNGQIQLGKYKVYAAADRDSLYTEENLIGEYDASKSRSQIQDFHWEDGKSLTGIKFVGMRVLDPLADWEEAKKLVTRPDLALKTLYPRIMEFNVYGEYEDPTFIPEKYTDTANYDLSLLSPTYGLNLINSITPSFFADGKRAAVRPATVSAVRNKVSELPSSETIHVDLNDSALLNKEYIDIQWKLQDVNKLEQYRVNGFAYQGMFRDMPDYYAGHYQVYVATDAEDLFKPENMAFEYKAEDMGLMKGIVYEFPSNKAPVGGYIGLRIIEPANGASNNANPRLSVFYVWGEDPGIVPEPTNLAENMPIDAYFTAKKLENISESNLTAEEVMNMTDSDDKTFAKIKTQGSNSKTTEFIYNLCGDMDIDKIAMNLLNNQTLGFDKLKVYASNTLAGVNMKDALIWTQSMKGKTGEVKLSKTISSKDKIRYVRFVFEGCKDYIQISTINIEGLDNQKNKTRDLTSTMDMNLVDIYKVVKADGKVRDLEFTANAKSAIFDTVTDTYPVIAHGGIVGEEDYGMLMKLDDLRTINRIKINFLYGFDEYYPDEINIYIAETLDEIEGDNAKTTPDYSFKTKDVKDSAYELAMRPRLVRYLKIEFKGFKKIEGTQLPDNQGYLLTSIIPDFSFKGTKVTGMQTSDESETLISFTDKETGFKADITRLDVNDIFTDVVGVRFIPEKATNWQMTSLKHNPFLKVIDKTIYKVEFYDVFGNVVNDLKGRNVDITMSVPEGAKTEEYMVGDATLRTKMVALETQVVNRKINAPLIWAPDADNKVALLQMVNEDDPYWETIGELEDFSEGTEEDLMGDSQPEEHDAEWYETIRTEDGRFEVKGVTSEIPEGVKFTAKDISKETPTELYQMLGDVIGDQYVAAIYDMSFSLNDTQYTYDGIVSIKINLPDFIKNNFTDLQVIHMLDETSATMPWCETVGDEFYFQADSFSKFVIIGTAIDPSYEENVGYIDDQGSESEDEIYGDDGSPVTGEKGITVPVLLFLVAAAYVIINSSRKKAR